MSKQRERKQGRERSRVEPPSRAAEKNAAGPPSWPQHAATGQWIFFALVIFAIVFFHWTVFARRGAFWRDECSTIALARVPTLGDMWGTLETDSFPALFVSLLRFWVQAIGGSDAGIRCFGILISLGTLTAAIACCRTLTQGVPLLAVALIGFNSTLLYFGSSIRAYGLASLSIVLCFAAFWRMIKKPDWRTIGLAAILAILSVQSNYQNCYLLFGIGVAAATVSAIQKLWGRSILVLAICLVAAISLLVYLPTISKYKELSQITHFDLPAIMVGKTLCDALSGKMFMLMVWLILVTVSVLGPLVQWILALRKRTPVGPLIPKMYCTLSLLISAVTGFCFFKANGMFPYVWHYIPFITLMAVVVETNLPRFPHRLWNIALETVLACLVIASSFTSVWDIARARRTNMDLVAAFLNRNAGAADFVLVSPFWLSPGFNYYYKGQADWNTLPIISADAKARNAHYAAIKKAMQAPNCIVPTLETIRKTLASGNRLWIVGVVQTLPPNTLPPNLPPAPQSRFGWNNNVYSQVWSMQVGYFLQTHALKAEKVPIPVTGPVIGLETEDLWRVEGWREQ